MGEVVDLSSRDRLRVSRRIVATPEHAATVLLFEGVRIERAGQGAPCLVLPLEDAEVNMRKDTEH